MSPSPLSDAGERPVQRGRPAPQNALTHSRTRLHAGGGGGRHTRRNILVDCHVLREGSPLLVANPAFARLPLIPPSCVTPILWRCLCSAASEYGRREASSAGPSTRVQAPAASSGAICIPTMSAEVRARSNRAPRGLTQHARTRERRQRQWQVVAKRPRTEPVDTDTQALLPAGDLLGVLQVFECFEAALRSQGTD